MASLASLCYCALPPHSWHSQVQVTMPIYPLAVISKEGVDPTTGFRPMIHGSTMMKKQAWDKQAIGRDNACYNIGMHSRRRHVRQMAFARAELECVFQSDCQSFIVLCWSHEDEWQIGHCSSFGCHIAVRDVAPGLYGTEGSSYGWLCWWWALSFVVVQVMVVVVGACVRVVGVMVGAHVQVVVVIVGTRLWVVVVMMGALVRVWWWGPQLEQVMGDRRGKDWKAYLWLHQLIFRTTWHIASWAWSTLRTMPSA